MSGVELNDANGYTSDAQKAANMLLGAFVWDKSPQGHTYWEEVYRNLLSLTKAAKAAEEDGE